jgi:hypothetical protein
MENNKTILTPLAFLFARLLRTRRSAFYLSVLYSLLEEERGEARTGSSIDEETKADGVWTMVVTVLLNWLDCCHFFSRS